MASNNDPSVAGSASNNNDSSTHTISPIMAGRSVPVAHYPPMLSLSGVATSTQLNKPSLKSSMSSSPQFLSRSPNETVRTRPTGPLPSSLAAPLYTNSLEHKGQSTQSMFSPQPRSRTRSVGETERPQQRASIRFSHQHPFLFGYINCRTPREQDKQHSASVAGKLGPVLFELGRVGVVKDWSVRRKGQLLETHPVTVSRGNPQFGASVASTCMSFPLSGNKTAVGTGLTTGALCVHTFRPEENWSSFVDYFASPRHHRPATAIAWKPNQSHVAIGMVSAGGGGGGGGVGGSGRGMGRASRGGDRDFCCLLWDVEHQSTATSTSVPTRGSSADPFYKLAHNAAVASLTWLSDTHTLAVGCQSRNLQLYDLRATGNAPSSIWAHNDAVNGIEIDPERPHFLATFSSGPDEPVKLWDARRLVSSIGEIKLSGAAQTTSAEMVTTTTPPPYATRTRSISGGSYNKTRPSGPSVNKIVWSSQQTGVLSVAVGKSIYHYDTIASTPRPVLSGVNCVAETVMDIAVYSWAHQKTDRGHPDNEVISEDETVLKDLLRQRMLVVTENRSIRDVAKSTSAPLTVSQRDGSIIHAFNRTVWANSPEQVGHDQTVVEDIATTIRRRAGGSKGQRYSMDAEINIQGLASELNGRIQTETPVACLINMWRWIERVESLRESSTDGLPIPVKSLLAKGDLLSAGVWKLLGMAQLGDSETSDFRDVVAMSHALGCNVYDSPARRATLHVCGWGDADSVEITMSGLNERGDYEHAAALAVWYGEIEMAVSSLQAGAMKVREQADGNNGAQRGETLELLSMCVAGFSSASSSSSSGVWKNACGALLKRLDAENVPTATSYVRHMLKFLLSIDDTDDWKKEIVDDDSLSLCDRVAFGCRFFPRVELQTQLQQYLAAAQEVGDMEGLAISGINGDGIKIMQTYVDSVGDIQTTALVASRVILPKDGKWEIEVCTEWLASYRGLLNSWQMWQSRAMFDVDRADFRRKVGRRVGGPVPPLRRQHPTSRRESPSKSKHDRRYTQVALPTPAQLDARCNFCSYPLSGAKHREAATNQWLMKMKSVISCCPRCRKPLPRCAICLLPLGCLNPYMEFKRQSNLNRTSDLSSLANLPFAEWFTWCMFCKHGGHAQHLVGWFANNDTCPVSGCNCQCQFDGLARLENQR